MLKNEVIWCLNIDLSRVNVNFLFFEAQETDDWW
jgi:hypothetical protein